jgi:cell division protein FtsB
MFNFLKKIFNMKKEETEIMKQQIADAIAVAQRLGAENKQLKEANDILTAENTQLKNDFSSAVERVKYLAEQLRMKESQQQATERFNDDDRNY